MDGKKWRQVKTVLSRSSAKRSKDVMAGGKCSHEGKCVFKVDP